MSTVRTVLSCLLALVFAAAPALAQTRAARPLQIYVVDVEGGNAALFVTPAGESVLIDTGNAGAVRPARCGPYHGSGEGCRAHSDRSPDHHALAWRPLRRSCRTRQTDSDPRVHRSRAERSTRRGGR